jgi:hypothetical protein
MGTKDKTETHTGASSSNAKVSCSLGKEHARKEDGRLVVIVINPLE